MYHRLESQKDKILAVERRAGDECVCICSKGQPKDETTKPTSTKPVLNSANYYDISGG